MTIQSAAMDAIFGDPNMAVDAFWIEQSTGARSAVRVIAKTPDEVTSFGQASLHSETTVFDVRCSDVVAPRPGDRVEVWGELFEVQGEPVRDRLRLVWTIDVRASE